MSVELEQMAERVSRVGLILDDEHALFRDRCGTLLVTRVVARFRLRLGTSPQRYLQRYRFSKAVRLLQNSDAKLYDIARSVGYDSESSFSKAFKRLMGKSPGAFRQVTPPAVASGTARLLASSPDSSPQNNS